ncbi:MAG: efflux RND transporter periplasmic adaptor subunit [Pseudomonadales bacterium]
MTLVNKITHGIAVLVAMISLAACDDSSKHSDEHATHAAEHAGTPDVEKGPHNGRLLRAGDLALEITVYEDGVPPMFRVFPTMSGKALDPKRVDLTMTLRRLDGEVNVFRFAPNGESLDGEGVVVEPHSFDVEVDAVVEGKRHEWRYASPEGQTAIPTATAKANGIVNETAGPATIDETRELYGTVQLASAARSEIRAQFPGRVVAVMKNVGDPVRSGDLLARIESSESLQVYPVYATAGGVVAERHGNPGDVTSDRPLYVITDLTQTTVAFNVFPRDLAVVRPGQQVSIKTADGEHVATSTLGDYLPDANTAAGTALLRASLPNQDLRYRPGMAMRGEVTVSSVLVPLAVRTEALQPFRDFTVVFANFGDVYEVRMLELGRRSATWTEVTGGLKPGTRYAAEGAFLIRADIEKSGASHDH